MAAWSVSGEALVKARELCNWGRWSDAIEATLSSKSTYVDHAGRRRTRVRYGA
ncbi:MAG TPA: hypothetical protein VNH11_08100 [Pirellulales bacterium]|nr:hypothetical protein [Pirellulales bacterium]